MHLKKKWKSLISCPDIYQYICTWKSKYPSLLLKLINIVSVIIVEKPQKTEPCTFQLHHTICFLFNPMQSISNSLQSINMFNSCLLFLNWFASSSLLSFHNSVKNYHIFFLKCSIGP